MPDPHYKDSECTGPDFIAGSALGQRAWMLDAHGWLRGVTYRQVWLPGENVARCLVTDSLPEDRTRALGPLTGYSSVDQLFRVAGVGFGPGAEGAVPVLQDGFTWAPCDGLDPACACGYYAYHRGHAGPPTYGFVGGVGYRVVGVIEGYGKVILGSKGFRAQKARIRAIYYPEPTNGDARVNELRRQLEHDLEVLDMLIDDGHIAGLANGTVIAAIMSIASGAAALADRRLWAVATALALAVAVITEKASRRIYARDLEKLKVLRDEVMTEIARVPDTFSVSVQRMIENYPDVEFFTEDSNAEYRKHWVSKLESLEYLLGDGE